MVSLTIEYDDDNHDVFEAFTQNISQSTVLENLGIIDFKVTVDDLKALFTIKSLRFLEVAADNSIPYQKWAIGNILPSHLRLMIEGVLM